MGFWATDAPVIIGDQYAEIIEKHLNAAAEEFRRRWPEATKIQFMATLRSCTYSIKAFDENLSDDALMRQREQIENAVWLRCKYPVKKERWGYGLCANCRFPQPTPD